MALYKYCILLLFIIIANVIYSGTLSSVFANVITDDVLLYSFRSGTQPVKNASGQSPRATTGQRMPSSSCMTSAVSRRLTVSPSGSMRWTCTPAPRSSRILSVGHSLTTSDTVHYSHAPYIHTPFNWLELKSGHPESPQVGHSRSKNTAQCSNSVYVVASSN